MLSGTCPNSVSNDCDSGGEVCDEVEVCRVADEGPSPGYWHSERTGVAGSSRSATRENNRIRTHPSQAQTRVLALLALSALRRAARRRELARRRLGWRRRGSGGAENPPTDAGRRSLHLWSYVLPHLVFSAQLRSCHPARPSGSKLQSRGGALRVFSTDSDLPQIQSLRQKDNFGFRCAGSDASARLHPSLSTSVRSHRSGAVPLSRVSFKQCHLSGGNERSMT